MVKFVKILKNRSKIKKLENEMIKFNDVVHSFSNSVIEFEGSMKSRLKSLDEDISLINNDSSNKHK